MTAPNKPPQPPDEDPEFDQEFQRSFLGLTQTLAVTGTITAHFIVSDEEFERLRKQMEDNQ